MAVSNTPAVDRATPSHNTGLMLSQRVSRPPEKSIKFNAVIPISWAMLALSKWIPPMPSEPANTPIIKKNISVGTPNLFVVLPAITLINNNIDPISKMFSISINISFDLPTLIIV